MTFQTPRRPPKRVNHWKRTLRTGMKTCTTCGHTKPMTEFVRNLATRDGHTSSCYACHAKNQAARARAKLTQTPTPAFPVATKPQAKRRVKRPAAPLGLWARFRVLWTGRL